MLDRHRQHRRPQRPSVAATGTRANHDHFQGNLLYAVSNSTGSTLDAENSFWGAADGPSPPGHGDAVVGLVDAVPFAATLGPVDAACGRNQPPDTSGACVSPDRLWPPDHGMVALAIGCITDPDGDPVTVTVTVTVTAISQDEPTDGLGDGDRSPDGQLEPLQVRAERWGRGDGRVYRIDFEASDGSASTPGSVIVCVPKTSHGACVDSRPPEYDSTLP